MTTSLDTVPLQVLDTQAAGDAGLPPLVLLHGIGASHEDWEFQVPYFAPQRRVIAPDLRGFGRSPHPRYYSVPLFAADVWAELDRRGIERFDLVGHSMGGAVALQMAVQQPARIRRIVLADTLPSFAVDRFGKWLLYVYRLWMMGLFGPQRLSRAVARNLFPAPEQAPLRARLLSRSRRHSRRVYLRTLRALKGWRIDDRLDRVTMPALVLVAEHDYFPVVDAEAFAAALPNARLQVFRGAHHHLPMEVSAAFNEAVKAFLSAPDATLAKTID